MGITIGQPHKQAFLNLIHLSPSIQSNYQSLPPLNLIVALLIQGPTLNVAMQTILIRKDPQFFSSNHRTIILLMDLGLHGGKAIILCPMISSSHPLAFVANKQANRTKFARL